MKSKSKLKNWHEKTLGNLVTFQRGHDLPRKTRNPGKIPVVGTNGIVGYHNEFKAKGPGIIVARSGAGIGKAIFIEEDFWPLNTTLYSKQFHNSDPKFVFYLIKTMGLERFNSGTAVPSLNRNYIHPLKITVPNNNEQYKISNILFTLDKQIKILKNCNKILDQISSSIFKSYFIDFNNQKKFINSELGQIPQGWQVSTIGKESLTVLGGTPSRKVDTYWKDGTISWINSSKTRDFRVVIPSELITKEGMKNSATKLLPQGTTIIAITGATVGQISLLEIESCANQSVVGILQNKKFPAEFIYFWMKNIIENILLWKTGGAQQHINKNNIDQTPILFPPSKIMNQYIELTRPIFKTIAKNCFKIINIKKIKNEFLPKLISGEIRV